MGRTVFSVECEMTSLIAFGMMAAGMFCLRGRIGAIRARTRSYARARRAAVAVIASFAALLVTAPAGGATFAGRNGHLLWYLNSGVGPPSLWVSGPRGQRAPRLPIRSRCGFAGASALFTRTG